MKKRLKKKQSTLSYQSRYSKPLYPTLQACIEDTSKKLEEIALRRGKTVLDLFIEIDDVLPIWTEEDTYFHKLYRRLGTAKSLKEKYGER